MLTELGKIQNFANDFEKSKKAGEKVNEFLLIAIVSIGYSFHPKSIKQATAMDKSKY